MAGDIREIDMPKATDMNNKKIRLVGDDGQGYWAEIKDFAPVVGELLTGGLFIRKIDIGGNFCLKIAKASIQKNTVFLCGGRTSSVLGKSMIRKIQGDETKYIVEVPSGDIDPHAREDNNYLYIGLAGDLEADGGLWNLGFLISSKSVEYGFATNSERDTIIALPTVTVDVLTPLTK